MSFVHLRRAAAAALAALALPAAAGAQQPVPQPAEITGIVADSSGTPLPNAQVFIVSLNRGTTTNAQGRYVLRAVPPGTYQLDVMLIGYAHSHESVTVPPGGGVQRVDFQLDPTPLQISGVVTTATITGGEALDLTQSTLSLSGRELARNVGAGVAQTLERQPGMATRYNGPLATMPVIRGLTGDRILVLQNGERTGDLAASAPDHAVSVDPLNAERIEVVRGPQSLLYGSSAVGGVVNVITNDIPNSVPNHVHGYASVYGGTASEGGAVSAGATTAIGGSNALHASGSVREFGETRVGGGRTLPNSDARSWTGVLGIGHITDRFTAGASGETFHFRYGLPTPFDDVEEALRIDGQRQQITARASYVPRSPNFTLLKVDGTAQWYEHQEIEPTGEIGTRFDLQTQTVSAIARTVLGGVPGAFGTQMVFKQYAPVGEEAFTPGADHANVGVFVFEDISLGNVADTARATHLQVGARYDYYRVASEDAPDTFGPGETRTFNALSGSVALNIPIAEGATVNASVARAFRAPAVEELFAEGYHAAAGTFDVGNSELEAEIVTGVESVVRVERPRLHAQVGAFYNWLADYIYPNPVGTAIVDGEPVPLVEISQADALLYGLEGQVEYQVVRHLVLGLMADAVRGRFDGDVRTGPDVLPFMPPARIGGSVRWDDNRWALGVHARHAFAQERVLDPDPDAPFAVDVPTGAYTLVDLSAGLNIIAGGQLHSVTLRVDNLLDEEYRDATSRIKRFSPNPGRNVALVYKIVF